jgi:hypothetical protein
MPTDSDDWPDEYYLEGPVTGGDELLRRTLANVRRQSTRSARWRVVLVAAGVLLAGAMLTGAGMAIGRLTQQSPAPTGQIVATDAHAGAAMRITTRTTEGGTYLVVTTTGLPVGTACRLTVTSRTGAHMDGGGWKVAPDAAQDPVDMMVWLPRSQVAQLTVTTSVGAILVGNAR